MYGAQAQHRPPLWQLQFENDVEMYGAQAGFCCSITFDVFENDVEMYGAQAWDNVKRY